MNITFIPNESQGGQELLDRLKEYCNFEKHQLQIYLPDKISIFEYLILSEDVLVVDASLEGNYKDIYMSLATTMHPPHIIYVSRTYTPLNIFNFDRGGIPPYPYPFSTIDNDFSWSNDNILDYIIQRVSYINTLSFRLRLGNSKKKNRSEATLEILDSSYEVERRFKSNYHRIFLSYRSRDYEYVKTLAKQLQHDKVNGKQIEPVYFRPGELTFGNELLSPARRWQTFGILEYEIGKCDELWIVGGPEYLNSWWTVGELVCVNYLNHLLEENMGVRETAVIVKYHSFYQNGFEKECLLLPTLEPYMAMQVARFTRPTSIYDMSRGMRDYQSIQSKKTKKEFWSRFGLGKLYSFILLMQELTKFAIAYVIMPKEIKQLVKEKFDISQLKGLNIVNNQSSYLEDPRWTESFWDHLQVPQPTAQFANWISDSDVQKVEIDLEKFLDFLSPDLYKTFPLSVIQLQLNEKHQKFTVAEYPPRYLLVKKGDKTQILSMPVYTLEETKG